MDQTQALFEIHQKYGAISQIDNLNNAVLGDYRIQGQLASGAFGHVYHGYEIESLTPIVVKFTKEHKMNDTEYQIMEEIQQNSNPNYFAKPLSKGKVIITDPRLPINNHGHGDSLFEQMESQICSFIVQTRLGKTLDSHFASCQGRFTEKTVVQIGLQLLTKLNAVHKTGYLFNDLKPNNIIVGDFDDQNQHQIKLIDFGISKKYLDQNGQHVKEEQVEMFMGNFVFASKNAFEFTTLSRRDDLISLCYVLLYFVDGTLPWVFQGGNRNLAVRRAEFARTKEMKIMMTPKLLCQSKSASMLLPFVEAVYSLKYDETPDYGQLRFMLLKILLDKDKVPDKEFDWRNIQTSHYSISVSGESALCDFDRVEEMPKIDDLPLEPVSQILNKYT